MDSSATMIELFSPRLIIGKISCPDPEWKLHEKMDAHRAVAKPLSKSLSRPLLLAGKLAGSHIEIRKNDS